MKKIILITSVIIIILIAIFFFVYKNGDDQGETVIQAKIEKIIKERSENPFGTSLFLNNYLVAREAVEQKTNTLFDDPKSATPKINVPTASAQVRTKINNKRAEINTLLRTWAELLVQNPTLDDSSLEALNEENRQIINSYLEELSSIVNDLSPSNSDLSQEEIDSLQEAVSEAQTTILTLDQSQIVTDTYIAPIIDNSGKPRLIEGINND
jgi:FtsZ-interacting cell division protein ZipA